MPLSAEPPELEIANNPAGRLYVHLTAAKNAGAKNPLARVIWGQIFGIDPNDTPKLMVHMTQLMQLTGEARAALRTLPDISQTTYEKHLQRIDEIFSAHFNLNDHWSNFANQVGQETLAGLELTAERLRESSPEQILESSQLRDLQSEIDALLQNVVEARLDGELTRSLVGALEEMRHAVLQYRLRGNAGILRAVDRSFMVVARRREEWEDTKRQPVLDKVLAFITKVDALVATVMRLAKLMPPMQKFLPATKDKAR